MGREDSGLSCHPVVDTYSFRQNFIDTFVGGSRLHSSHLSLVVSDLLVELLALQTQEVLPGENYATLACDGAGGVDVVSGNHTYSDAGTLALRNSLGYLQERQEKVCFQNVKLRSSTEEKTLYTSSEEAIFPDL